MGVNRDRVIQLTFLSVASWPAAAAAAVHAEDRRHPVRRRVHPRRQGVHRGGPRRHRQPARRAARRASSSGWPRTTARPSSAPSGRTSSRSSCWSSSCCSGRPACWASRWEGHGHERRASRRSRRTGVEARLTAQAWPRSVARGWLPRACSMAVLFSAFALPLLDTPIITTPDSDFGGVLFTVATYVLVALGLNIVVGYAGLLDLGYVGFYAVGAYTVGVLGVRARPRAVAALRAGRGGRRHGLRHHPGRARRCGVRGDYLAIVTLGLRRDHPAHRGQLRLARRGSRHHQRAAAAERRLFDDPAPRLDSGPPSSTWTPRPRS